VLSGDRLTEALFKRAYWDLYIISAASRDKRLFGHQKAADALTERAHWRAIKKVA